MTECSYKHRAYSQSSISEVALHFRATTPILPWLVTCYEQEKAKTVTPSRLLPFKWHIGGGRETVCCMPLVLLEREGTYIAT